MEKILVISLEIIEKVQNYGVCDIGNDNADGQVVISGDLKAVEKAIELAKKMVLKELFYFQLVLLFIVD